MHGSNKPAAAPKWIQKELKLSRDIPKLKAVASSEIRAGSRNTVLTSYAGGMRQRDVPLDEIERRLLDINEKRCKPPLPAREVRAIAASISRYDPMSVDVVSMTLNDAGNADRLVHAIARRMRYVTEWDTFLRWNGTHWMRCNIGQAMQSAKAVVKAIASEAEAHPDLTTRKLLMAHARQSLNQNRLRAMCELARYDPRLRIDHRRLDANPYRLAVANGVVNLKTGKFRKHRRSDFITRVAPVKYDREADCPVFQAFLKRVSGDDKRLYCYLYRLLGYLLTGATTEQKFFFLYGSGANGKSTFLSVVRALLGQDLVKAMPASSLMVKHHGRSTTNDLARLEGARVVTSNEIEDGAFFDEPLIKELTGGEPLAVRYLYGEFFEYNPQFKLFIAGNHQPVIRGDDHGIWRRVELIPFAVTIPESERDPRIAEKLQAELPGILRMAVSGCLTWQRRGLDTPDIVSKARDAYRDEMDLVGKWLKDAAVRGQGITWKAGEMYESYRRWCMGNGLSALSATALGRKLKTKFQTKRTKNGIVYQRVGPRPIKESDAGTAH